MIDKLTQDILNDPIYLKKHDEIFNKLQAFYDGKEFDTTLNLNGYVFIPTGIDPFKEPERYIDKALEDMANFAKNYWQDDKILRPLTLFFDPYGVHTIDKMLGADVFNVDGQWNVRYLNTPVGELKMPDLENDPTWKLCKQMTLYFLKQNVKLPIYGLPTIASPLNIALNIYGQEILFAFLEDEQAALHDLRIICDVEKKIHQWYRENLPKEQLQLVVPWERTQPYDCGQICGCSTQLISKDMYKDLVSPFDNELLGVYANPGMIHLCGSHLQHIETFASMKNLKAVQLHNRAAEDLQGYIDGLRKDQVIYVNTCVEMPYEKALEISKGKRVIFVGENKVKEVK